MDSLMMHLDRLLSWLMLPATLYGAGGALLHAKRQGKPLRQTLAEVVGGALVANVVCPIIQDVTPESYHYTLFFLVGWGGLELVSRVYETVAAALEGRIRRRMDDL